MAFFAPLGGYVEFAGQCRTSCPTGFESVGSVCEECTGDCEKGEVCERVLFV